MSFVFSRAKQNKEGRWNLEGGPIKEKENNSTKYECLSQALTNVTSCETYIDAPSNWYSVFTIFMIRSFAYSQCFGSSMCTNINCGPTSSPLIEHCIVSLNFTHHGYLFIYFRSCHYAPTFVANI